MQALPNGSVVTYGDVARSAGKPNNSRQIGRILYQLRKDDPDLFLPWWRVVNASGKISIADVLKQQRLLEQEGIEFRSIGTIKNFAARRFPIDLLDILK